MFDVQFYEDKNGVAPIKDFLIELQSKGKTSKTDRIRSEKIITYIRVLEDYGTRAGEPYMKHIEENIWELRPLRDRILFFYFKNGIFVLLHHFVKKTKKTPATEIKRAKNNLNDFLERKGEGQ